MKKIMYLLFSLLIMLSVAGCGSTKTVADTKAADKVATAPSDIDTAKTFINNYLTLYVSEQWDQIYVSLHQNIQAKYPKEQFITDHKATRAVYAESIKSFSVDKVVILDTWTDSKGTGVEYKNVAEVSFTNSLKDGTTSADSMHLAKASDGTWRWFCTPPKEVDTPAAPAPVVVEKKWVVTNSWSGNGAKDTENFAVTEDTRVNWETTDAKGIFQIYIQDTKGTPVGVVANMQGIGKDVSYLHLAPGQYSFKINSAFTPWEITIEQQQ